MTDKNILTPEEEDYVVTRLIISEYTSVAILTYCKLKGLDEDEASRFVSKFLASTGIDEGMDEYKQAFFRYLKSQVAKVKEDIAKETA